MSENSETRPDSKLTVRLSPDRLQSYREAAKATGHTLSSWVRYTLSTAAENDMFWINRNKHLTNPKES